MLTYEELRKHLPIELDNLDEDCSLQPELYMEAVELASVAKEEAAIAKDELDRIEAQTAVDYRSGEIVTEIKKTEESIKALVTCHPDVVNAKAILRKKQKDAQKMEGLVNSYDHRRSMLNNETDMFNGQYNHCGDIKGRRAEATEEDIRKIRRARNGEEE